MYTFEGLRLVGNIGTCYEGFYRDCSPLFRTNHQSTSRSVSKSETTTPKLMPFPGLDILFDLLERRAQQLGFSMVLGFGPLK